MKTGYFKEKEVGNWFFFEPNPDTDFEWAKEFPHRVQTGKQIEQWRYAIVKKTVAYICVDEDEYGRPVLEKWNILNKGI